VARSNLCGNSRGSRTPLSLVWGVLAEHADLGFQNRRVDFKGLVVVAYVKAMAMFPRFSSGLGHILFDPGLAALAPLRLPQSPSRPCHTPVAS
jgi:hypothetical protein